MKSLKAQIFSNGELVTSNIVSIDIMKRVNKIPYAQVVITEGSGNDKSLKEISDHDYFKPGNEVELSLSHNGNSDTFKGLVVKHNIRQVSEGTFLTIDIKDSSLKLALQRKSAVFTEKDDKQIITDVAQQADISVEYTASKIYKHKQLVQYYCSNWDFIVSRAEANGLLVIVENGTLIIKEPQLNDAATEISEIYELELEADMGSQFKEVEGVCWDIKEAALGKYKNTNSGNVQLGGAHDFEAMSGAMGTDSCLMVNGVYAEKDEIELWANAQFTKNRLSMIRGLVTTIGNAKVKLGDNIKIAQAGANFDSTSVVTGIRHRIKRGEWNTDIQCGLSPTWFYEKDDIIDRPAAGMVPGINGLQVGIVEAFPSDGDPEKFHRIKVKIPAVHEQESVIWARLLLPYAGNNAGMFFVPEVGDEVVIGFFNDDPRHAVVIGSLYNGKTTPPLEFTDKNNDKGIVTRNGIKMVFTDEDSKEKIEISTPGGNKILVEDEKGIAVTDKNQNKVTFDDKGIVVEDKNKNKVTTDDKGILVVDKNNNGMTYSSDGIEIKDANGNTVTLSSAGIEVKDMNGNKVALAAGGVSIETPSQLGLKGQAISMN